MHMICTCVARALEHGLVHTPWHTHTHAQAWLAHRMASAERPALIEQLVHFARTALRLAALARRPPPQQLCEAVDALVRREVHGGAATG